MPNNDLTFTVITKSIKMETTNNHRSIRKYKDTPIEPNLLNQILLSGTRASNTGNMQVYSMVVTQDRALKSELCNIHFGQPMVNQAPVHITFCADINRFNAWCKLNDAEPAYDNFLWLYNATIDAVLASQNVAIEAEDNGLGICYLGTTTYMADKIISLLNLPKGVVPVTAITLGYPDEQPNLTDRLPLEGIVHYETYKPYTNEDIIAIYKEKENLESTKKLIEENKTQNLSQIFTEKRYKGPDNKHFSKAFLKVLEQQGFMNQ